MNLYDVLESPLVYRTAQFILAPGMDRIVTGQLARIFAGIPPPAKVLDVGCGPVSWLWKLGLKPIGLDLCHPYTKKFHAAANLAVTGSAAALPFPKNCFDVVFSYGLLHHLPELMARETVSEMIRVTRPHGHVIMFDPVLPKIAWSRPQSWALCKLDRGRFIGSQQRYERRILGHPDWKTQRFTHSYLGTEGLFSLLQKASPEPD